MTAAEEPIEPLSSEGEHAGPHRAHEPLLGACDVLEGPTCPNIYTKACRCKKDNPNCLAGLIPSPTGFRRKGLWQRDLKALLGAGIDPRNECREASFVVTQVTLWLKRTQAKLGL